MSWRKSPQELIDRFYEALPSDLLVEPRKMFGYPCAFVHGNMFTGLHQENMIIRLPEKLRKDLIENHGASLFEPMPGRIMKEYVSLPKNILQDLPELKKWLNKSLDYTAALPPKAKKNKKPPKNSSSN